MPNISLQQLIQQALLLQQSGNLEQARALYEYILHQVPNLPDVHNNLANILQLQHEYLQACHHYRRALQLRPNFAHAHFNLARALEQLKQGEQALTHYQRAVDLKLESAELFFSLARFFKEREQFQEAIEQYMLSLEIDSDRAITHHELAILLFSQGQTTQALKHFHKAYTIESTPALFSNLLFCMRAVPEKGYSELFELVSQYCSTFKQPEKRLSIINLNPEKRLKIGYISNNFYQHSTAAVFEHLFLHHNREQFEVIAYPGPEAEDPDEATLRFRSMSDRWNPLIDKTSEQVFEKIQQDELDILVDLVGHMEGNHLKALAQKPAPIQITGLGFGATTGSSAFDYCFLDPQIVSTGDIKYFSEKVHFLKTLLCWLPPEFEIEVGKLPFNKNGYITFGCANSLFKLNHQVIQLWSNVLKAIPNSKLSLKAKHLTSPDIQHFVMSQFKAQGISESQLSLTGRSSHEKHLRFYQTIDIALDPFPYDGGVSTCEALWMGVPVLSKGTIAGRSLLHQVNLHHLIQREDNSFIQMAVDLANDSGYLNELRQNLRQRLLTSTICDGLLYTRQIEQAYRMLWRIWCVSGQ